jgi:deoxyribodipyrimidine photo-lyase
LIKSMSSPEPRRDRIVHWFRSDLRLRDNTALAAAARRADALVLLFVLDDRLLAGDRAGPPRLRFLAGSLARLAADLAARGQQLVVRRGDPVRVVPALLRELRADAVTWNADHGPYARRRDAAVRRAAERDGVAVAMHEDRVVFGPDELRTGSGDAFRVYTPFRNAWWRRWDEAPRLPGGPLRLPPPVPGVRSEPLPAGLGAGAGSVELPAPGEAAALRRLDAFLAGPVARYAADRDRPDLDGTSRLSPYLHLGALSPRQCFERALAAEREEPRARAGVRKWLDELIWREFYVAILAHHPHAATRNFRPEFDALRWEDDEAGFAAWCAGRTGYPFVDAGLRQLARTGWMHNRPRMVVASFLTKDLLIDWRRGERFFQRHLVDGDLASNNGGWQWAASTGTDAQPWFRIFNPVAQGERFDPRGDYVRRFVPELRELPDRFVHRPWEAPSPPRDYPAPIVDHAERRVRALRRFEAIRPVAAAAPGRAPRGVAERAAGGRGRRASPKPGPGDRLRREHDGETLDLFRS